MKQRTILFVGIKTYHPSLILPLFLGSASPQAVRKLLSLAEQSKTRPHTRQSPGAIRRGGSASGASGGGGSGGGHHERSHSDTPPLPAYHHSALLTSVDLNAESSSVTSLSNMPLRKTLTSGIYCLFLF